MTFLFVLIGLGVVFWFIAIQPQRRRQQQHSAMQDSVAKGLEIITAGGLHGVVVEAGEDVLRIEIADGVVVRLDRRAVAAVVEPEEPEDEPDEEAETEEPVEPQDEAQPPGEEDLPPVEPAKNPYGTEREAG